MRQGSMNRLEANLVSCIHMGILENGVEGGLKSGNSLLSVGLRSESFEFLQLLRSLAEAATRSR